MHTQKLEPHSGWVPSSHPKEGGREGSGKKGGMEEALSAVLSYTDINPIGSGPQPHESI